MVNVHFHVPVAVVSSSVSWAKQVRAALATNNMQSSIRVPRFAATDASCHSKTPFPLTPSLSLGERANHSAFFSENEPQRPILDCSGRGKHPLPKGEGWGEGEGGVRMVVASDFMRSLCITVLPS